MSTTSPTGARRTNTTAATTTSSNASSTSPRQISSSSAMAGSSSAAAAAAPARAMTTATTTTAASSSPPALQPTIPSAETQRHVEEARSAVVASIGNMLDAELQSRARMLHENAAALSKQERDVVRATDGLRKETAKLAREADVAARRLKEVGNVQNWAEVLERGFLVLEETVRLANGGTDDEDDEDDGRSCSCSCSECGRESDGGSMVMDLDHADGEDDVAATGLARKSIDDDDDDAKGKAREVLDVDMLSEIDVDVGQSSSSAWSDASRSLMEPDSSVAGTERAKGSETASIAASVSTT